MTDKKRVTNLNLTDSQIEELNELKYLTNTSMSEIVRRLFFYLPQVRQALIDETRRRLRDK